MQETTFPVQIFVHDDASSDKTAAIIREYESLHPHLFLAVLQSENLFSRGIGRKIDHLLFGRYIAYCEGDDYWTHPWKLDLQCDYLLLNPGVSLVYHPVLVLDEGNNPLGDYTKPPASDNHFQYFIKHGNFIHTPSVVLINHGFPLPPEASASPAADFFYWLLALERGRMHMMPNTMAFYRWGSGIWSSLPKVESGIKTITILLAVREYFFRVGFLTECEILERRIMKGCSSLYPHITNQQVRSWSLIGPSSSRLVSGFFMQVIELGHYQASVMAMMKRLYATAKRIAKYLLRRSHL